MPIEASTIKNAVTVERSTLPSLTVPQLLAFAAFVLLCVLTALSNKTVTPDEFHEVRRLAVFLIGALLPSDALIRFGRNIFLRKIEDPGEGGVLASDANAPKDLPATTLPQCLAFAVYLLVLFLTLISNKIVDETEFKDVIDVAVILIAALLPSEAAIRFGRALYLGGAKNVTKAHLKKI